ncbi:unnamed protein product [Urochloa decumbens]|uniref:CASP-like protein n=1 Tax=Urochloa decumbens TaxID=240449 RepID=A0ABC9DTE9_9POAL
MERQCSVLTKLGFAALACNSALAIYRSWGDAGSVAFVLAADAALVLLFLCVRQFEEQARGRDRIGGAGAQYDALARMGFATAACNSALSAHTLLLRTRESTWSGNGDAGSVAFVLAADAALVFLFLCLRRFGSRPAAGTGSAAPAPNTMPLARTGFAAAACNSTLLAHGASAGGAASQAFVLLAYAALLALTWLFLRGFDGRAHGARR